MDKLKNFLEAYIYLVVRTMAKENNSDETQRLFMGVNFQ